MSRLATGFWVAAYRARLEAALIPVVITARGDETAGAVIVKQIPLDGSATAWHRSFDATGARVWVVLKQGPEAEVDAELARQRGFDRDLWIIEVEDRAGRHLLDEEGLG